MLHVDAPAGGGGRPLVALTPIGAAGFSASLPAGLHDRFAVHVVELPGTGRSVGAPAEQTVESTVAAVRDVLRELGGRDALLFGHSMNGTLALAAAADSTPCAGVIAVCAPPRLPTDAPVSEAYWVQQAEPRRKALAAELIAAHDATSDDGERTQLRGRYDRLRRWYDLDFDPTALDALAHLELSWVQSIFDSATRTDWPRTMAAVSCPVLLALGEYDFVVPPTSWDGAALPPRTTVERFGRSGHTPFFEQPDEFLAAVDRWRP